MSGDEGSSLLMSDEEERSALGESFVAPGDRERTLSWHRIARAHGIDARRLDRGVLDDIDRGGCDRVAEHMCNLAASVGVAMRCLFTADSALGCGLSVFYTLLYWRWGQHLSVNMSWNIVSLAVVFPVSQGISMSFKRREQALGEFGNLLGNLRALWGALHSWKVKGEADGEWVRVIEKFEDTEATEHKMRELFEELLTGMITYFDVPRWGRARHSIGCCGREEGQQLQEITHEQKLCVDSSIARAQRLVQELKALGLSGGETHRLDQCKCSRSLCVF